MRCWTVRCVLAFGGDCLHPSDAHFGGGRGAGSPGSEDLLLSQVLPPKLGGPGGGAQEGGRHFSGRGLPTPAAETKLLVKEADTVPPAPHLLSQGFRGEGEAFAFLKQAFWVIPNHLKL